MEEKRARIYYKVFNPRIEKVNSLNTVKFFIALLDKVEEDTGKIILPPAYKKEVCRMAEIKDKSFSRCMKKLEEVDLVRKVVNGVYFINPLAVWKGSTETREFAIPEYLKINAIFTDCVETIHSQL